MDKDVELGTKTKTVRKVCAKNKNKTKASNKAQDSNESGDEEEGREGDVQTRNLNQKKGGARQ